MVCTRMYEYCPPPRPAIIKPPAPLTSKKTDLILIINIQLIIMYWYICVYICLRRMQAMTAIYDQAKYFNQSFVFILVLDPDRGRGTMEL